MIETDVLKALYCQAVETLALSTRGVKLHVFNLHGLTVYRTRSYRRAAGATISRVWVEWCAARRLANMGAVRAEAKVFGMVVIFRRSLYNGVAVPPSPVACGDL